MEQDFATIIAIFAIIAFAISLYLWVKLWNAVLTQIAQAREEIVHVLRWQNFVYISPDDFKRLVEKGEAPFVFVWYDKQSAAYWYSATVQQDRIAACSKSELSFSEKCDVIKQQEEIDT